MFRRLRKIPLAVSVRAGLPFYELDRTLPDSIQPGSGETLTVKGPTSRYEAPILLMFTIGF